MQKIISVGRALKVSEREKRKGKKIVLSGGVFDILHYGHLQFLEKAKRQGDILIVILEPDAKVRKIKGKRRPINNEKIRAYMIAALECVDYVVILPELTNDQQYFWLTKKLSPDIIAVTKGDAKLSQKLKQIEAIGGKLKVVSKKIPTPSTSKLTKLLSIE